MSEMHSKRLIQHDILEILKEYTDADHRLSQQQIQHHLEADYGISVDRKTVRRYLSALLEADEEHICFKEGVTRTRIGKKQAILYELVSAGTSEEGVSSRRRSHRAYYR